MGLVRIYQERGEGLFFLGEERIGHTGLLEERRLILGGAFHLTGLRRTVERRELGPNSYMERVEILVRNTRDEEASVIVEGELGRGWRIEEASHDYEVYDLDKALFYVTIPPEEEKVIEYSRVNR